MPSDREFIKRWAHCTICGVQFSNQMPWHPDHLACIRALQGVIERQRAAASTLAFEVSTQFLAVLEQLAAHPDVGIPFRIPYIDPETGKDALGSVQNVKVAGIFSAILKKYSEMGDWSPLKELRDKVAELEAELATRPPAAPPPDHPGS